MVSRALRSLSIAAILLSSIATLRAKDPATYQIGDRAEEDIVTPVQLTVIDVSATKVLKQREGERVPVHMRFYTNSAAEAEAAFRSAFAATRGAFLTALDATFSTRTLTNADLESPRFEEFVVLFQQRNPLFPVNLSLGKAWAAGDSGEPFVEGPAVKLREAMKRPVRNLESPPPELKIGSTARLIPLAGTNEAITAQLAEQRGINYPKTSLMSFQRTRSELQDSFPAEERAVGRYAATFLKPNCLVETNLTLELREKRTAGILASDQYDAGQIIARRGQIIDEKIKAALDRMKEKTAVGQLQELVVTSKVKSAENKERVRWLIASASALFLISVIAIWRLARRRTVTLLPAPIPSGPLERSPLDGDAADGSWRQRALLAEERAQKAQALVRAGVMAHLAQWMSDKLTRRLISQRQEMLQTQQKATAEMDKTGERLETIHTRMQDRLLAYERRIAELEKELETKGEANRELIKAEILAIKRQLEAEREKNRLEFN